jgi:signal transduction histidine kinase/DNA-binding response OmpR family regulator
MNPGALWDRMPFAARLLVTASIALVVAGIAMLAVSARQEAADARSDLQAVLRQELETLPAALAETVVIGDFATLQQTLDRYVLRPLIVEARFRDTTGVALASTDRTPVAAAPAAFVALFGYAPASGQAPVAVGGRTYGELTLTLSPDALAERAWHRLLHHLAILLLAIAVDFVGIWLVLRQGLRPLQQLEQATEAIAAGRFYTQLAPVGSPELRRLTARFNRMAAQIQADIAEREQHASALLAAKQEAEAANRAKSEFLANMSHEIRTPMNAILGMLQLALDAQGAAERRDLIGKGHRAAQTLLGIINDILDFSKIEAGKLDLEHIAFALKPLAADLADLFAPAAAEHGLAFRIDLDPGLPAALWGDPLRLRQVLQNLIGNAIKFTRAGGVVVTVAPAAHSASGGPDWVRLRCAVADTGIGIAPEQQVRLFESFSQADSSTTRRYGGTGLGLAISRRLVSLMGGEIGVDSAPGAGSSFWFELPCEIAPAAALPTETTGQAQAHAADLAGSRVLLVEDNALNQEVAMHFLRAAGIRARLAADGAAALAALAEEDFDAVLMDCQMPVMDGYEATRRIRAEARHADLPIIAMTANALIGDRERSLEAGMSDHLTKPLDATRFYATLARWLGGSHAATTSPADAMTTMPTPTSAPIPDDAAAQPRLDSDGAVANLSGDRALYAQIVEVFLEDQANQLSELTAALAAADHATARRHAHTIKGMASAVGAERLRLRALALEHACKAADPAAIAVAEPPLHTELEATNQALQEYLAAR